MDSFDLNKLSVEDEDVLSDVGENANKFQQIVNNEIDLNEILYYPGESWFLKTRVSRVSFIQ